MVIMPREKQISSKPSISHPQQNHIREAKTEILLILKVKRHISVPVLKKGIDTRIDMHLRKSKTKGIAIDGQKIKKASELLGLLNIVFFSPEDLNIIKNGPAERRRFADMELCQLDKFYLYNLDHYNKIVNQRNKLLREMYENPSLRDTLHIWDMQLVSYGSKIIERRNKFAEELNEIIYEKHKKLSGGKENIIVRYEPDVTEENFDKMLKRKSIP